MINGNRLEPVQILLVEDSPQDAELAIEAFSEGKIRKQIHLVEDGVKAIAFLLKKGDYKNAPRPDLIIMDLNLPKKNGLQVLEEIKNNPNIKLIPVVIFTTSSAYEDVYQSYFKQANCYMSKPGNLEEFVAAIKLLEDFWFSIVKLPY